MMVEIMIYRLASSHFACGCTTSDVAYIMYMYHTLPELHEFTLGM